MFTVVKVYAVVYGSINTDISQSEEHIRAGANLDISLLKCCEQNAAPNSSKTGPESESKPI